MTLSDPYLLQTTLFSKCCIAFPMFGTGEDRHITFAHGLSMVSTSHADDKSLPQRGVVGVTWPICKFLGPVPMSLERVKLGITNLLCRL